ncbi:expressed unknown protein [Seminavis robusta]|uniref:Uncharacterized protein n=1 Tax=Seminavis robusta TaxID=568900 RepID=A0A9N8E7X1_9STRA|nr:expressed unknown protein [Seminavis robusta]|eukprot:Sro591_g172050.1 n/a (182) ;mRNA; r:37306-37851
MKVFATLLISFLALSNFFGTSALAQTQEFIGSPESLYPLVVNVRDPMGATTCPIKNDQQPRSLLFELSTFDRIADKYSFQLLETQTGCRFQVAGMVPHSVDVSIQVDGAYAGPMQVTMPGLSTDTILNNEDGHDYFMLTVDDVTSVDPASGRGHRVPVSVFRGPLSSFVMDGVVTFQFDLE